MKQDLNLSLIDLLGYVLPGSLVVGYISFRNNLLFDPELVFYLLAGSISYLLGHLYLMFHFITIKRFANWIFGDPKKSLPEKLKRKDFSKKFWGGISFFFGKFRLWLNRKIRNFIGVPPLSKALEKEIWDKKNWKYISGHELASPYGERDLMHLYWWAITNTDNLYKRNRRLRALELLFGNSTFSLVILSIFYFIDQNQPMAWLCSIGGILCFLSYCRYRFYSLRLISIYGYLQIKGGQHKDVDSALIEI